MNVNISVMVCRDGVWHGLRPTCGRLWSGIRDLACRHYL